MSEIIEKELSYRVNGCIFDVHNEVGPGLREECYQAAMMIRLRLAGLPFQSKPHTRRELVYLGMIADVFEPDFIIAERLIIELKTHQEGTPTAFFRQTINYLKFWKLEVGLLVNMADADADIRRVVFHEPPPMVTEDFSFVRGLMSAATREKMIAVREVILSVHREFGLGYSDSTYRQLLCIGLRHRGFRCDAELIAQPTFREYRLPSSPITPLSVDAEILVQVEAIHDGVSTRNVRSMQTHLDCMNAEVGVVASFGQSRLEIRGVRRKGRPNQTERE